MQERALATLDKLKQQVDSGDIVGLVVIATSSDGLVDMIQVLNINSGSSFRSPPRSDTPAPP